MTLFSVVLPHMSRRTAGLGMSLVKYMCALANRNVLKVSGSPL